MGKMYDPGQWAEGKARDHMRVMEGKHARFTYHRLPDAKAAQGQLAAQPSDYIVANGSGIFFLEIKETKETTRLPKNKVRQYGMLKKWWLAGIMPRVLVYRSTSNDWTYFTEGELFALEDAPASFPMADRPKFASEKEALTEMFL